MSDLSKVCSRLGDRAAPIVLQATLAQLNLYWLDLQCCGRTVDLPMRVMVSRHGGQRPLASLLDRLRCERCGGPPARATLTETNNRAFNNGPAAGWSVQLIPQASPALPVAARA